MARKVGVVVAIIRGGGKTNFNISMGAVADEQIAPQQPFLKDVQQKKSGFQQINIGFIMAI